MIKLTKSPRSVPDVVVAPAGLLAPGGVYVVEQAIGGPQSQLRDGDHAVLKTDGGQLELSTVARAAGMVELGTYVNQADAEKLGLPTRPTLRLYGRLDTLKKALSRQGAVLLISTLVGLVAASAAIYFAVYGASSTGADTVAQRAQTAQEWVVAPADRLDGTATSAEVIAAREAVHQRAVIAARCLRGLSGAESPPATIPGLTCSVQSPPWYRDTGVLTWLTLAVGLLTALFATMGLRDKFGFQKTPAS